MSSFTGQAQVDVAQCKEMGVDVVVLNPCSRLIPKGMGPQHVLGLDVEILVSLSCYVMWCVFLGGFFHTIHVRLWQYRLDFKQEKQREFRALGLTWLLCCVDEYARIATFQESKHLNV